MPAFAVPLMLSPRYARLAGTPELAATIAFDRLLLITIACTGMGLVALATWDGMLPDRRDARILSPLPISVPTFVAARLAVGGATVPPHQIAYADPSPFKEFGWSTMAELGRRAGQA